MRQNETNEGTMNQTTTTTPATRWMVMSSDGWAIQSYTTKKSAQRRANQYGGSVKPFTPKHPVQDPS
ncbi:MAG: hypothetical protein V3S82_05235 [Dehalococcoidia bacterium]